MSEVKTRVTCGANHHDAEEVVGSTIAEVREGLREVLNISEDSHAVVNGDLAGASYEIQEGDTIEFVQRSGTKG
jgi:molybdopterin converting factor small subunit